MIRAQLSRWIKPALIAVIAAAWAPLFSQTRDERAVRAAYLYNLIKYVDWPANRGELLIAYIGDKASGDDLKQLLDGKTSDSHTIHLIVAPQDDELAKCSVVYIAEEKTIETRKELDKLKGKNIITIGETEAFARDGGMVGLVKMEDHIQIEVNLEAAQRAGVRISSRVLDLAVIVRPTQNEKN